MASTNLYLTFAFLTNYRCQQLFRSGGQQDSYILQSPIYLAMFSALNKSSGASSNDLFDQSNALQNSAHETVAGDFWLITRLGEDWPVLVCDENMVQNFFNKEKGRPENAVQANGKWTKAYQMGGIDEEKRCFPCVFLGSYKL